MGKEEVIKGGRKEKNKKIEFVAEEQ